MPTTLKYTSLYLMAISLLISQFLRAEDAPQSPKGLSVSETFTNPDFRDEDPSTRIKDITTVKGVRDNYLVGRGIVVGLNGTGDSLSTSPQTKESLVSMLERLGVNIRDGNISGKNVAMVMVTATLPAFARSGSKIDVAVSAMGDAKSLNGGTLIVTSLQGADGRVYAVAQGNISVSGVSGAGINAQQTKGVPTAGKIADGALIEREVEYELTDLKAVKLLLREPDVTTAKRIVEAINAFGKARKWGDAVAKAHDMGTIDLSLPKELAPMDLLYEIGHLEVRPDIKARIVIDENNGVIAMSTKTRISPVALTHGSITVKVVEEPRVYMPNLNINNPYMGGALSGQTVLSLEAAAQEKIAMRDLQKEQMILLEKKQEAELKKFEEENKSIVNEQSYISQHNDMIKMHEKAKLQLSQNFNEQLAAIDKKAVQGNNMPAMNPMMMPGMMGGINPLNQTFATASGMDSVITSNTNLSVKEEKGKFNLLSSGPTIDKLVNALNQLGVSVKDMGSILMAIKNTGALHAEIKIG